MYDDERQVVEDLEFTFVDIDGTVGLPEDSTYEQFDWLTVNFASDLTLTGLDSASLDTFVQKMETDADLARKFELYRTGSSLDNERLIGDAVSYYKYNKLLREDATNADAFTRPEDFTKTACMMRSSEDSETLDACLAAIERNHHKWSNPYSFLQ